MAPRRKAAGAVGVSSRGASAHDPKDVAMVDVPELMPESMTHPCRPGDGRGLKTPRLREGATCTKRQDAASTLGSLRSVAPSGSRIKKPPPAKGDGFR